MIFKANSFFKFIDYKYKTSLDDVKRIADILILYVMVNNNTIVGSIIMYLDLNIMKL